MINYQEKQKGAAMLMFILFFLLASVTLTYLISKNVWFDLSSHRVFVDSKKSYLAALGANEDMAYRFVAGLTPDNTESITLNGVGATSTVVYNAVDDLYNVVSKGKNNSAYRSTAIELAVGSGASFNFGVQTGNGGFEMTNGSSVRGNVFSNGTIEKTGGGTATVYGDVISGGPTGLISNMVATGSAWANTIEDSNIFGTVYYENISNTSYGAAVYTTDNQATSAMPISDEKIDLWKEEIETTGTIIASTSPECSGGTYFVDYDLTLGYHKIECDFVLKKQGAATVLTLDGPLWVEGNIDFQSGPTVEIDPTVGNRSVQVIADNESNRATSSRISVGQSTIFTGSGSPKSYVLLLSQNTDAENGEVENVDAINIDQSSNGDLLVYASHGRVAMGNSISLKEVTGYKIVLGNSAEIIYESGLVNLLFTSGPGGGFTINSWRSVK